ncbi:glycosyltransferase [Leuconostoc mesenteroides]|jgi:glycosyltransferase involved in cell wall biosynthesis|uniref:GT n=2 Tax=Leuconostoc mesenteroides TaxID=1245 RepID=A0A7S6VFT0_LEUME|nr:glycosyltransferase [Leuconostoc mesenteroides]MCI2120656.1 glycosyltransferase [Leuconostoc mesenteroides]QOW37934.1 GT [Leuconostoc mesenteroides]
MISVLMSVYNESKDILGKSIYSIEMQSFQDWELIIVNDNPENKNLSMFLEEKAKNNPNIKLITNKKNIGLVNSLNVAFRMSQGDYIARMDADDISAFDRLEKQLSFLTYGNLDFVFSNVQSIDETGQASKQAVLPERNLLDNQKIRRVIEVSDIAFHPTWLMKKNVMRLLNGYRLVDSAEDYDFVIRSLRSHFKLAYQGEVLLQYRYRLDSISRSNGLRQEKINKILQKGLSDQKNWEEWSLNQVRNLRIDASEEHKLSNILQLGVSFKRSRKLGDMVRLVWNIFLYPKSVLSITKRILIDKKIQQIFSI